MSRPCVSCTHVKAREIDRKLRSGDTIENVVRWLKDAGQPVSINALSRHRKEHVYGVVAVPRGPRSTSTNFLQAVVERSRENMEAGVTMVTVQHGIAAQAEINRQADKMADRDLMLIVAQALGGTIEGKYEVLPDEAEFRQLLPSGE